MANRLTTALALLLIGCPSDDPASSPDGGGVVPGDVAPTDVAPEAGGDLSESDVPADGDVPALEEVDGPGDAGPDTRQPGCTSDDDCLADLGDLGVCEVPLCEDGECTIDGAPNGAPCDDGDPCTTGDACQMAECTGQVSTCDDANDCTMDLCDPATGDCTNTPLDGDPCNDGDLCSSPDLCEEGECTGAPGQCPACAVDADCTAFDDGNPCNGAPTCVSGECQTAPGGGVDCSSIPVGPCQEAVCAPATGACAVVTRPNGSPCEPTAICQESGFCNNGKCNGLPKSCNDGNPCTEDSCSEPFGCANDALGGVPCDDGSVCTTGDICQAGKCVGTAGLSCDDGNPCTADGCNADSGQCTHTTSTGPCEDGDPCTIGETCQGGLCSGGVPGCDDGDACTTETCVQGECVYAAVDCDDGDPCNVDACEPDEGCVYTTSGTACDSAADCGPPIGCSGWTCGPCGTCVAAPLDCDDGDLCTTDTCAEPGGCVHGPAPGAPCDDGNPCTAGETCTAGGTCTGGGNVCELGTETNPAVSCLSIKQSDKTKQTGTYWLRPNANVAKFQAWCDMDINGGGWTRVAAAWADTALCSLGTAIGTSADLLGTPTQTAVLPLSVAGALPMTLKQIMVNIPGKGWTIFLSNAPGWSWANVATGMIHSVNVADHAVLASVNGSGYVTLTSTPVGPGLKGPGLLGGNSPNGYTPFLGVGAQITGSFTQDAACAALTNYRGLWGGTWLDAVSWQIKGTIYVR